MRRSAQGARLDQIESVYRQRLSELRRVATAITGSRETALDAVQDAFAIAVHRRTQFRGEGSLDAWLWRIVVNAARDAVARQVSSQTADERFALAEPESELGDGGLPKVHALLYELPERQRLALFLRYYADLDYATIANALDISAGTVGATLNHARESLRRSLEEVRS